MTFFPDILFGFLIWATMAGIALLFFGHFWKQPDEEILPKNTLRKIEEQLPAFFDGLASSLSAGNSLQQSMSISVQKTSDPLMTFVQGILLQHKAGLSLDDALKTEANRISSGTISLALNSVAASYRSGSNMVEALSLLSTLCRERTNLRKKILTRTAQSRMQGNVIVAVPLLFMILLYFVSPQNMIPVIGTALGRNILVSALLLQATGAILVRKILKQEIL